jgi:hypothetical protein
MQEWAKNVDLKNLDDDIIGKINGVGLATVQNLRLIFFLINSQPKLSTEDLTEPCGMLIVYI